MKGNLQIYYDEEGDYLELHVGEYKQGSFKTVGEGIFERIDTQGNITGIAIHGFRKRTQGKAKLILPIQMTLDS